MEVKERLISQIGEITDGALLEELEIIIADLRGAQSTPYLLDDAMIASLDRSENEIEEGKGIAHEDVIKTLKEWLKER